MAARRPRLHWPKQGTVPVRAEPACPELVEGSKHEQSRALVLVISNAIVHPSTCSGRTEYEHLYPAPQMPLFTLRHAQGERNTSTCTRLRRCHCLPFDTLRANGIRALVPGSADASVYPSTCSGRTEYEHLYPAPQMPLFTLQHAQGERNTSTCTRLRRCLCLPFDRLRANGIRALVPGSADASVYPSTRSGRTVE